MDPESMLSACAPQNSAYEFADIRKFPAYVRMCSLGMRYIIFQDV